MAWFKRKRSGDRTHFEPLAPCEPIADELVEAVPELSAAVEDFFGEWGDEPPRPGLVNLADQVLFPFIEQVLTGSSSQELLARLFEFLEEMASHSEEHVRDALQVGVVNPLLDAPRLFEIAKPLMGEKMLAMVDMGRAGASPSSS